MEETALMVSDEIIEGNWQPQSGYDSLMHLAERDQHSRGSAVGMLLAGI
jgi:hypothetical protein